MNQQSKPTRNIAVIGGGITGLAAAHRLTELLPAAQVTLFEAGDRLGGVIQTVERDGCLIERSADSFITSLPWAVELCRRIGMADELLPTNASRRRAMVLKQGRLLPVPEGFLLMQPKRAWPVMTSPILSLRGKLRLLGEYFVRRREDQSDESLACFTRRRLGSEAFERLVQPLVGGIYTADPEKLSMQATLGNMVAMEQRHGSLMRAARREPGTRSSADGGAARREDSGARYSMFVAPRRGLCRLIEAIAARLPEGSIRLNSPAARIVRAGRQRWQVELGESAETLDFDAVLVAARAPQAAALLNEVDPQLAGDLNRIQYAGASVVVTAFRSEQLGRPIEGFGFVVPAIEHRRILAVSFSSTKFPGRAPDGVVLIRTFVGGALQPELAALSDAPLKSLVFEELSELLEIRGEPLLVECCRWLGTMPQYHVGHLQLVEAIERRAAELPGLELAGNAYHGVGIPQCIHSGESAAERIANAINASD